MNRSTKVVVSLDRFEGPLDLLLYLIRKEEMDIFDIPIHQITGQYLEYVRRLKEFDIELAGDFIAMAATLMQIKSRMLLPQYNEQGEIIETEDPRKELVQKLLEYQKYKEAADLLYQRPIVGRDIWLRGEREVFKVENNEIELEENALFTLIGSFRRIYRAFEKRVHRVAKKAQSIAGRILELSGILTLGKRFEFSKLVAGAEDAKKQVLITFLSLLELGKLGFVGLYQNETFGEIYIDLKKEINSDVVSRVEEFDGLSKEKAEEAALKLIEEQDEMAILDESFVAEQPIKEGDFLSHEGVAIQNKEEEDLSANPLGMATDEDILAAELALDNQPSEFLSSFMEDLKDKENDHG